MGLSCKIFYSHSAIGKMRLKRNSLSKSTSWLNMRFKLEMWNTNWRSPKSQISFLATPLLLHLRLVILLEIKPIHTYSELSPFIVTVAYSNVRGGRIVASFTRSLLSQFYRMANYTLEWAIPIMIRRSMHRNKCLWIDCLLDAIHNAEKCTIPAKITKEISSSFV